MKKVLFIDRDGTIIIEPPIDFQVDSLEKLSFLPGAIKYLGKIANELDYELVLVTNQDGLGTSSFPEDSFWPAQNKMMEILQGEGIHFSAVHIDKSFEKEQLETRKPGIGMLKEYFSANYDLKNSIVIGDRLTDIQLAKNLGATGILLKGPQAPKELEDVIVKKADSWEEIYFTLKFPERKVIHERNTKETQIKITLNLDGKGNSIISTGLHFFDHMLEQIAKHGGFDLEIACQGDLEIDEHHTIEDTGLALGEAFLKALGNKKGINRYGFLLPMDDCLAQVALDFGGRNWLVWEAEFNREMIGQVPTEMFFHFFKSFSDASKSNLNIKVEGKNEHHKIEAIFKAFAKSLKMATEIDQKNPDLLPSTKGTI